MRRLTALRWLSAVLMLSGWLGSFPPAARARATGHACCTGARVCRCADHGTRAGATDPRHAGCRLRAAGCVPLAAALPGAPSVLVVLAAGVPLAVPAQSATAIQPRRDTARFGSSRPDTPPPRLSA